ncbi:Major facilitator superfamily multidrug transporter mfsB [Fulvia fulva]|uniref:Major facilitator superfamily multidrug transporter mfsB n=1 Tax=Passalora fulva TaxID=5499 RepID=A0A9Q8P4B2_PASFU|nr:Major facilitator superfamily multidrug transporter mfsB [Fulvia fulva]KAK4636197.1 Major facilitator superfamily multidrug transporter mfsB [Fulvia fulva]UJO12557.1 Major facilitator superfamily multidrug transporter mfsB [Fulvia fulva]WPV08370.1 Major facilitator superfamily multidrug transporter mfsB [Fulvia fulva]WPV25034.1 Major facilitator superfamily multidrug transporter mfsB [Fulvia fulva]
MFGFHSRSRSLIPVGDLEKTGGTQISWNDVTPEQEEEEVAVQSPRERRNLIMIYLLFLAEAIMSSSLSSQINLLLPSTSACLTMDTTFLRSILQCAYYFGGASGIVFGLAADRLGRRKVALFGLIGMSTCCISMGFATNFTAFCILRYIAGAIGSAATVAGLAMLADSTHGSKRRVKVIARLPMLAVCGQLGPLLSNAIRQLAQDHFAGVFARFPGLGVQMACAALVISIAVAEICLLDETLPKNDPKDFEQDEYVDCEKAAFLGQQRSSTDSNDSLAISIIEALNDDTATPRPSRISVSQMLTAPSILVLLASYAVLSLHSSTFEVVLQHIAHTDAENAGMGIPCSWMQPLMLVVKAVAALRVMHFIPKLVSNGSVLPLYRKISMVFPALYIIIPAVALAVHATGAAPILSAVVSTMATLAKTTLANAAQVLVLLLVLSAAPDASSTGTLIGVVSITELFKALAVGLAGISYYVSDSHSMFVINTSLWAALAAIALVGTLLTTKLRAAPRLGPDLPSECFVWQGMFDVESDDEAGF